MNQAVKKELISYGGIAAVALLLYLTGLHTQVISYLQRAVLATGLVRPNTEQVDDQALANSPKLNMDVLLMDAKGQMVNMQQFEDKVIFINLWATWCPPCLAEMPNIHQLYQDLAEEDIVFIMLSTDRDFSKAVAYTADQEYNFPIYQAAGNWPARLNSSSIPATFVINRESRLVLEHRGMAKYNTTNFKTFLRGLL